MKRRLVREIVIERLKILLFYSKKFSSHEKEFARRFSKLCTHYKIRGMKRIICEKCLSFLFPVKVEVDTKEKKIVWVCQKCGYKKYIPYK